MPSRWRESDEGCIFCGVPTARATHKHNYLHCGSPTCKRLFGFWYCRGDLGDRPRIFKYRGPCVYLYEIAIYLMKMCEPMTARELEFSKRFAHRRAHS